MSAKYYKNSLRIKILLAYDRLISYHYFSLCEQLDFLCNLQFLKRNSAFSNLLHYYLMFCLLFIQECMSLNASVKELFFGVTQNYANSIITTMLNKRSLFCFNRFSFNCLFARKIQDPL